MKLSDKQLRELRRSDVAVTGNRIAEAMRLLGLTQEQVAEGTGFTQPYVSAVARGQFGTITLDNAYKFVEFFEGCSVEDLFPAKEAVAS